MKKKENGIVMVTNGKPGIEQVHACTR